MSDSSSVKAAIVAIAIAVTTASSAPWWLDRLFPKTTEDAKEPDRISNMDAGAQNEGSGSANEQRTFPNSGSSQEPPAVFVDPSELEIVSDVPSIIEAADEPAPGVLQVEYITTVPGRFPAGRARRDVQLDSPIDCARVCLERDWCAIAGWVAEDRERISADGTCHLFDRDDGQNVTSIGELVLRKTSRAH